MNRGKDLLYNQLIDTIDYFGDYYLDLNNNDNNIILDLPILNTIFNDMNISIIYNHQKKNEIKDLGEGFKLNHYMTCSGNINSFIIERNDSTIDIISGFHLNQLENGDLASINYNDLGDDDYEVYGASITTNDYNRISLDIDKKYPNYIIYKNNETINYTFINNILQTIYNSKGDILLFEYNNSNYISKITYKRNNTLLNEIDFSYTNTKLTSIIVKNGLYNLKEIYISYNTNYINFIYKNCSTTINSFKIINNSLDKIIEIQDDINTLLNIEYNNLYTRVYDKYSIISNNNYIDYYFVDNKLKYIKDNKNNYSYFEYNNYKLVYSVEDINTILDNSNIYNNWSLNNSLLLNSESEYTLFIISSSITTIEINNNVYSNSYIKSITFKPNSGLNTINFNSYTSESIILLIENKDYIKYTYDNRSRINLEKRLNNSVTYTYDNKGNVTNILKEEYNKELLTLNYYDTNSNIIRQILKEDNVIKEYKYFTYNQSKRLERVYVVDTNNITELTPISDLTLEEIQYNEYNNYLLISTKEYGIKKEYTYDNRFRVSKITIGVVSNNTFIKNKEIINNYDNYDRLEFETIKTYNYQNNDYVLENEITIENYKLEFNTLYSRIIENNVSLNTYNFTYDTHKRIKEEKNNNIIINSYEYNLNNDIESINKNNNEYEFEYNNEGLISNVLLNDNNYESYTYDNKKRVTRIDDYISNNYKTYSYDNKDRLTYIYDTNGYIREFISYDSNNNVVTKKYTSNRPYNDINYLYRNNQEINKEEIYEFDTKKEYDEILFDNNMISLKGVKPINSPEASYEKINGITHLNLDTDYLTYKFNNRNNLTLLLKYYLDDLNDRNILLLDDGSYEIKIFVENQKLYYKVPTQNKTYLRDLNTGSHTLVLSMGVEEVDLGDGDTLDETVIYVIYDNSNNSYSYSGKTLDYIPFNYFETKIYNKVELILYELIYSSNSLINQMNSLINYDIYHITKEYDINNDKLINQEIFKEAITNTNQRTNILNIEYVYDEENITGININNNSIKFESSYNTSGEIISNILKINNQVEYNHEYNYDKSNRLISDELNNYEYYNNGDIKSVTNINNNSSIIYNYSSNKLTSIIDNNITYNVSYTNNFYISSFKGNNYTYTNNSLTGYSNNNSNYSYTYNSNGLRISKTNNVTNQTTYYIYDESDNLIIEYKNNQYVYYIYNKNELIGFKYNNIRYYYIKDICDRIVLVVDESGNIKCKYDYSSYGNIINIVEDSSISGINNMKYKSYYYDNESELYYLKSRYYSPYLKRFISPDSLSNLDYNDINGYNLYFYCNNNPIMFIDPNGNKSFFNRLVRFFEDHIIPRIEKNGDTITFHNQTFNPYTPGLELLLFSIKSKDRSFKSVLLEYELHKGAEIIFFGPKILDFTLGKFGYDDVPIISDLANLYDRAEDIDIEDSPYWLTNIFGINKESYTAKITAGIVYAATTSPASLALKGGRKLYGKAKVKIKKWLK